jgi:IS4 transposase
MLKTHLSKKQDKSHRENYSNILIEKLIQIDRKSLQISQIQGQYSRISK